MIYRDAADKVVQQSGKLEELEVASHDIAASTAQLVAASRVKARPKSDKLKGLKASSRNGAFRYKVYGWPVAYILEVLAFTCSLYTSLWVVCSILEVLAFSFSTCLYTSLWVGCCILEAFYLFTFDL